METKRVPLEVRRRVLDRIRAAIAEGRDEDAMRIARELMRRWRTAEARREEIEALLYA